MIDPTLLSEIRNYYVSVNLETSGPTLLDMAEKYQVDYADLRAVFKQEGWEELREKREAIFRSSLAIEESKSLQEQALNLVETRGKLFKANLEAAKMLPTMVRMLEERLAAGEVSTKELIAGMRVLLSLNLEMGKLIEKIQKDVTEEDEDIDKATKDLVDKASIIKAIKSGGTFQLDESLDDERSQIFELLDGSKEKRR